MQTTHSMRVFLPGGDKVSNFVRIANQYPFPIKLHYGKYRINGKSLVGIFSMDLSKPLTVHAECTEEEAEKLFAELKPYAATME